MAQGLSYCGRQKLAVELINEQFDFSYGLKEIHWGYIGFIRFLAHDYRSAIDAFEFVEDSAPFIGAIQVAALAHAGEIKRAKRELGIYLEKVKHHWNYEQQPTDGDVANWVLQLFPIKERNDLENLVVGLSLAGLPTTQIVQDVNGIPA